MQIRFRPQLASRRHRR